MRAFKSSFSQWYCENKFFSGTKRPSDINAEYLQGYIERQMVCVLSPQKPLSPTALQLICSASSPLQLFLHCFLLCMHILWGWNQQSSCLQVLVILFCPLMPHLRLSYSCSIAWHCTKELN